MSDIGQVIEREGLYHAKMVNAMLLLVASAEIPEISHCAKRSIAPAHVAAATP
jgi:hypothetical protein